MHLASKIILQSEGTEKTASTIDTSFLLRELISRYEKKETPIHVDFRRLTPWMKLGDQNTHHLHPYPGKVLPNIASFFLRSSILARGNIQVLDPFCGSGTVALEASLAGFRPIIADANPLALLITKVKTYPYDPLVLLDEMRCVIRSFKRCRSAPIIDVVNSDIWYTKKRKLELERLLRCLKNIDEQMIRDFFLVIFSVLARRLSNADPAISVPVKIKEKAGLSPEANASIRRHIWWSRSVSAINEFERLCVDNIERIRAANAACPNRVGASIVGSNARMIRSAMITSS